MVWCGERNGRWCRSPAPGPQGSGDAVDFGGFDGLFKGERRQDAGEALGEHRLAGTGRADHQDVVDAGGGDFERAFGHGLAAHVAEVRRRIGCMRSGRCATATAGENSSGRVSRATTSAR